jgi:hypothetical protein
MGMGSACPDLTAGSGVATADSDFASGFLFSSWQVQDVTVISTPAVKMHSRDLMQVGFGIVYFP